MGRRQIPKNEKKVPSEYPQLTFRVSKAKKNELMVQVEAVQNARNERRKPDEAFINKNDVIIEALELGLKAMKKRD